MKRRQACLLSFILAHFNSLSESGVVSVGLWLNKICIFSAVLCVSSPAPSGTGERSLLNLGLYSKFGWKFERTSIAANKKGG
jgi:hypothetical protein